MADCMDCPTKNMRMVRNSGILGWGPWTRINPYQCNHGAKYDVDTGRSGTVFESPDLFSSIACTLIYHGSAPNKRIVTHPATCRRCGFEFVVMERSHEEWRDGERVTVVEGYDVKHPNVTTITRKEDGSEQSRTARDSKGFVPWTDKFHRAESV